MQDPNETPKQEPFSQPFQDHPYYQNQQQYPNPNQQNSNPNQQQNSNPNQQNPNQQTPNYNQQQYYPDPNQQQYPNYNPQNPNQQQYYPNQQQSNYPLHPSYQPGAGYALPGLGEELPGAQSIMLLGTLSIVLFFIGGGMILGGIALYRVSVARAMVEEYPKRYAAASIVKMETGRSCAIIGAVLSVVFAFVAMYLLLEYSQNEPYADPYAY